MMSFDLNDYLAEGETLSQVYEPGECVEDDGAYEGSDHGGEHDSDFGSDGSSEFAPGLSDSDKEGALRT